MLEMSPRLELQQLTPDCAYHRYSDESVKIPFSAQFQWRRCVDCGSYTLEAINPDQEKIDFVASKGFAWMVDHYYLPEDISRGFFTLQQAYEMALEFSK